MQKKREENNCDEIKRRKTLKKKSTGKLNKEERQKEHLARRIRVLNLNLTRTSAADKRAGAVDQEGEGRKGADKIS